MPPRRSNTVVPMIGTRSPTLKLELSWDDEDSLNEAEPLLAIVKARVGMESDRVD
jgi:hypothetical protein